MKKKKAEKRQDSQRDFDGIITRVIVFAIVIVYTGVDYCVFLHVCTNGLCIGKNRPQRWYGRMIDRFARLTGVCCYYRGRSRCDRRFENTEECSRS